MTHTPSVCTTKTGLGQIKGLEFEDLNVRQYFGIPYAKVPGRFRPSVLVESWDGPHDGTKLGTMIPQIARSFYPIPLFARDYLNTPEQSEFGLELNISVPNHSGPMPVMVFIHGGANTYGAATTCIYDGLQLASNSVKFNQPTIIVTINYRLGAIGFLASTDLKEFNAKHGERTGNYGISDQTNALMWVNKYIKDFGGDTSNITLFGQSAGSQAAHVALLRKQGLFQRAILQSGLAPLCSIFTVEEYDKLYFKLLKKLGIDVNLSGPERVAALLAVDEPTLTQANEDLYPIQFVTMAYTQDLEVSLPSWSEVGIKVAGEIMLGDCTNECIIWNSEYKDFTAKTFVEAMYDKCSTKDSAEKFMSLYGINEKLSKEEIFDKIEVMTSDGMFLLPNYLFYQANPDACVYHFEQKSTYENEWKDHAHHSLDNVYIWGLLKDTLPEEARDLSTKMSAAWIGFANGKKPWESYGKNRKAMIFGDNKATVLAQDEDPIRTKKCLIWNEIIEADLVEEFGRVCEDICLDRKDIRA